MELSGKQTEVLFTLSDSDHNTLCESLEAQQNHPISFLPYKTFTELFFSNKVMKFETCVFASMSASLQCEKVCPEHVYETNI